MLNNLLKKSKNVMSRFNEPGLFAKTRINYATLKFMYDGDYSYLQSEEENIFRENENNRSEDSVALIWLKQPGYKSKKFREASVVRRDLSWLKIEGYKSKIINTRIPKQKLMDYNPANETVYEKIQLLKAKQQFYFSAMTMLILINLFLLLCIFLPA